MKPYVLCHMVTSIDGRIWGSRWRPKANVVPNLFETLHDRLVAEGGTSGSWLCGRVTAQEFARGKGKVYPPTGETLPRENWYAFDETARRGIKAWGIFLDAHGKAVWERRDIGGDPILVILTEQVPDSHLAGLRGEGISYIFAGRDSIDLAQALETLNRELGLTRILLEGGGRRQRCAAAGRPGRRDQPGDLARGRWQQRRADRLQLGRQRPRPRAGRKHDAGQ